MSNRWRRIKPELTTQTTNPHNAQLQVTATQTYYSGPIVHPEIAEQWEAVLPGAADRIMSQFENQSSHRQTIELKQLGWNNSKEILGQVLAFIIFMTALIGGVYLIAVGQGTGGLVAIIGALITPIALFIAGRRGAIIELLKKRKAVQPPQQS